MKKLLTLCVLSFAATGCTSIQVNNSNGFQPQNVKQICVIKNPKVIVDGFEDSIVRSFARYNVKAEIYPANAKPLFCETSMQYTALRTWDIVPYLSYARFTIIKDGRFASDAEFRLKGGGGMALNKWRSTDTKVDELVDQLMGKNSTK
ncbi:Sbal_3080 family lipoprotein [uncultured Acinetobacter sp.]|uniref:Sbal_3080 family lipoprotein n=1 Tax=uncultured Acinetobacter sp. TaxID=165433 RepID=UPI0025E3D34C|nr:Sbal_3080 family lipoprotein [uncultured Acinetobacter sp.]